MADSLKAADDGQVTVRYWIWGPLRLALGLMQMVLAIAAAASALTAGLDERTWLLVAAATSAMLASRRLYRAPGTAEGKAE